MQQNSDTFLLESKLKRLKISFSKENGRLIIGQAKRDYVVLFGLIIFPLLFGICAVLYLIFGEAGFVAAHNKKIIVLIVFLFFIGIGNIFRMLTKVAVNKSTKILGHKEIVLKTKENSQRFDAHSIDKFEYTIEEVGEDDFQGNLLLIDTKQQAYLLLGFTSETEQYAVDDLQWFVNYFEQHVQLKS